MDITIKPQPTVQLINVGRVAAKPANDLHAGDVIIWNFGYTSAVVDITPRGKTQIVVELFNHNTCTRASRVMSKTRLVAVKGL